MTKLVVISKGRPREIEMGQELTIGRGYSNLLRLEGDEISRVHAIIYRRDDTFILRDLDSKNGIYLNGSKVNQAELGAGDRLQVGKYKMVFNPPLEFDMNAFVDSVVAHERSSQVSKGGVGSGDAEFVSLRRFNVASGVGAGAGRESEGSGQSQGSGPWEEVTFLSRQELADRIGNPGSRVMDQMADFHEVFMRELARNLADRKTSGAGGDVFLGRLLEAAVHALGADRGVVVLKDRKSGALQAGAMVTRGDDVAVNRVVLRSAFSEFKAILCPDTRESGLFRENETVNRDKIGSLVSVPVGEGEPTALLYFDRTGDSDGFGMAHLLMTGHVGRLMEFHLQSLPS